MALEAASAIWQVVRMTSADGSVLHGILAEPSAKTRGLIVHVHGTWGNFYGNRFVTEVGERAVREGWSFASLNFPGHDETAMEEHIQDFRPALDGWLDELGHSFDPLILLGHSLGALKVLDYTSQGRTGVAASLAGCILLAAFDCVGFYERESTTTNRAANDLLDSREIVSESIFPHWLLRWSTLRELVAPQGPWDLFRSRFGSGEELLRNALPVPAMFMIGSDDFAGVPSGTEVHELAVASGAFTRTVLVDGAPHGFGGYEDTVASEVTQWLDGLLPRR